jgi:crossover junction endodeoxyribonuclease RusA
MANIAIEFCPPDYRRRDRDNLIASMKAATDGLADALGIDDSKFITSYRMGQPVKGGAVLVTVRQA